MFATFLVLFYVVGTWGAWAAWRRNPLYSNRLTLRLGGAILIGVTAFFAAVVGATRLAEHRSPAVAVAIIGSVSLFGMLALIWALLQFSLPTTAVLPPATKLVRVNRSRLTPWAWRFGWTLIAFTALAFALPADAKLAVYAVGGAVTAFGVVALFTADIVARSLDRSLTSVEIHPWVHWNYTPEQWATWTAAEVDRITTVRLPWEWHTGEWRTNGIVLGFVLLITTVPIFIVNFDPADWLTDAAIVGIFWVVIISTLLLTNLYAKGAPGRLRRLLSKAAPQTYFGGGGVFADGIFTEWKTISNYLSEAIVDERDPRSLTFVFVRSVSGGATIEVRRSVLIPPNSAADIERLQAELSQTCPAARIALD